VVPGDIIEVKQGDKVPADIRVIKLRTINLNLDQSSFTGETNVAKLSEQVKEGGDDIQSRRNILFSASLVSTGSAIGVCIATGMKTEIGKIQK